MIATEYSVLTTQEINSVFQDWLNQTKEKVLALAKENKNPKEIGQNLKLSEKSVHFIICKLAQEGKIGIKTINE